MLWVMDWFKLRAWWSHRQGLDGSLQGNTCAEVLEKVGWARSVGGANPYITLHARNGASRESIDQAVANLEIHELPSARGCTYVLPASHYALGLRVGQGFNEESAMNMARKYLGVTDAEIERLSEKILVALEKGPLDPTELKEAVGDAVRNLGDEGKKRGQTTTLSLSLGFLQVRGQIRRVPIGGRIDQQRYKYTLWKPSPLDGFGKSIEEVRTEVARQYFSWIGPASLAHLQWFTGLGVKVCKEITAGIDLVEIGDGYLLPAFQKEEYEAFRAPQEEQISLVAGLDSLFLLRREVACLLGPEDVGKETATDKAVVPINSLQDLYCNAIIDRGQLIGLWEYDFELGELVWHTFSKPTAAVRQEIAKVEKYAQEQLGDVRSFSLDSPKSRVPKLEMMRRLAKGS